MCFTKAMHTLQIPVAQICHLNKPSKVLILQKSCVRSSSVKCPQMPLESFCCSERHRMSNPLWLLITCSICVLPIRMKKKTLCDYWKLNQEPSHFQFNSPIAKNPNRYNFFWKLCLSSSANANVSIFETPPSTMEEKIEWMDEFGIREGFTKKSCCSFGFCPNYLQFPPTGKYFSLLGKKSCSFLANSIIFLGAGKGGGIEIISFFSFSNSSKLSAVCSFVVFPESRFTQL